MSSGRSRAVRVLLVEDNPGDVDLIMEALTTSKREHSLTVAVDGVEALHKLNQPGDLPDLVMLDLNLPRKDGRAVLREMKADPRLRHIPVVVLSSSDADRDLGDAYELQASCFVTKPADLDEFLLAVRGIEHFWMHVAKLPPHREPRLVT